MEDNYNTAKRSLEKARADLAEKVSIAGLKEAIQEHIPWIRRIYQITIIIFACLIVYKTRRLIIDWMHSGYKNEINDRANLDFLPMSNVTVCAPVHFNETFIRENLTISENVIKEYTKKTGQTVDDLYEQLTILLSYTNRPRKISSAAMKYISKILYSNKQVNDFSAFTTAGLLTCENFLKQCWFDGKKFDCCRGAVQDINEDGTCFLIRVSQIRSKNCMQYFAQLVTLLCVGIVQ